MPACVLFILCSVLLTGKALGNSVTNPERNFGYSIGDILEQSVSLDNDNAVVTIPALPEIKREGAWVKRHSVQLSDDKRQLILRYQIINAPRATRIITLPSLVLTTHTDASINIPAWSFSVAPIIASATDTENPLPAMQADWQPEAPATAPTLMRIAQLAKALFLTLLLWLGWWLWRGAREARLLPFAQAYRSIKKHSDNSSSDSQASWLSLHRAFDHAAERSVGIDTVQSLFQKHEWLKPFEENINNFYTHSSTRFYSPVEHEDGVDVLALSKDLYLAEKKHTKQLKEKPLPSMTDEPSSNL